MEQPCRQQAGHRAPQLTRAHWLPNLPQSLRRIKEHCGAAPMRVALDDSVLLEQTVSKHSLLLRDDRGDAPGPVEAAVGKFPRRIDSVKRADEFVLLVGQVLLQQRIERQRELPTGGGDL